jgi:hypothetical protein
MICHEKNGKPVEASSMGAVRQFMQVVPARESFGSVIPRRQASPLWVRPIAINGGFGLLFTVLASRFKNHNEEEIRKFLDLNFPGEYLRVKGWNQ